MGYISHLGLNCKKHYMTTSNHHSIDHYILFCYHYTLFLTSNVPQTWIFVCLNSQQHFRLHIADFVGEVLERDQTRDPWLSGGLPVVGGDYLNNNNWGKVWLFGDRIYVLMTDWYTIHFVAISC